jgi:hypothetical protein
MSYHPEFEAPARRFADSSLLYALGTLVLFGLGILIGHAL